MRRLSEMRVQTAEKASPVLCMGATCLEKDPLLASSRRVAPAGLDLVLVPRLRSWCR
jgi:hypothetical protein